MKKTILTISLLSFILAFFTYQVSMSQVTQEWVARYNGPGNFTDQAEPIVVDDSGNVFITGTSTGSGTGRDYTTIKYNSSGVQQWVQRYNGPGNSNDGASSIALDGIGNVYVTGGCEVIGTDDDYVTIKYNSSGVQQWVQRYNGPGNSDDEAQYITADSIGNVYVTGWSKGTGTEEDYATIKYNAEGDSVWVNRYNGPGNSDDRASSISLDGLGNVYVTGWSIGIGTDNDYATIKYNSAGDSIWVKRYSSPGNSNDRAYSIALDGSGNVHVTGYGTGNGSGEDYTTIKYNSAGDSVWVKRYNGPGNSSDYAFSIALDSSGNVLVTGYSTGLGTGWDFATIKYNSSGDLVWVKRYNGTGNSTEYAFSVILDGSSNVYVTGYSSVSGTNYDYATIKYNSSGDSIWLIKYNGPGNGYDGARSIALDGSGNVYVTGFSTGSGTGWDYATIKYSQSTGISQLSTEIPEQFSLSQNYPNPFNPVTNLEFWISDLGFVSLKVYNVLGKEVKTLVNKKLSPGKYKVEFDGSGLPSGVYFYRINAGEFMDTKKMMIIK